MNIRRIFALILPTLCAVSLAGLMSTVGAQAAWVVNKTPNPSGAKQSGLEGISCLSATSCQATGAYSNQFNEGVPLAERWTLGEWILTPAPNPKNSQGGALAGIACTTTSFCEAVGNYNASPRLGLAEGWNGGAWSVQETPRLEEFFAAQTWRLSHVSCPSATACEAVGWYNESANETGRYNPVALSWNGTKWTSQGLIGESEVLRGVSCPSSASCEAVGNSTGAGSFARAKRWTGAKWESQTIPGPQGAESVQVNAVSCASTSACEATGFYVASHVDKPLAESWNGTQWTVQTVPSPEGAKLSTLDDVSCPSAESCRAAGHYENSSSVNVTLVEIWNGATWAIESTPNPTGAKGSLLHGISCWSATHCDSAGEYTNSSGVKVTLVEAL